jgi:hypothetical protein
VATIRRPEHNAKSDYHQYSGAELKNIITQGSIEGERAALVFHKDFPLQLVDEHPDLTDFMWRETCFAIAPIRWLIMLCKAQCPPMPGDTRGKAGVTQVQIDALVAAGVQQPIRQLLLLGVVCARQTKYRWHTALMC